MNPIEVYENQECNSQLQDVPVAPKSRKMKIFLAFVCVGVLIGITKDLIVMVFQFNKKETGEYCFEAIRRKFKLER